ncbi:hypothetical protein RJ641_022939 [Dillenia turbinata]|uniref:Protein RIK n=1 Tax=Dillenia turbinata TaxID=194707 RepID=A0AAN8YXN0_9MAGN
MMEENPNVSGESPATESSSTRQRRKRKWDQPAESLVSAGVTVPGILPLSGMVSLIGSSLPAVSPVSGSLLANPLATNCATIPQVLQAPLLQQHAAAVVQKLIQPKIQDELIAREIVINDAESTVRYKLTKRQTQEEIQKVTGAVVITRGKYRPPNALPDGEKPLYLHISAGSHIQETADRIKAVDRAAAMVEEMLKHGSSPSLSATHSTVSNGAKVTQPLSTMVFLGFEADPSMNIAARIRGPNDQYINHIMNETGATVELRGCGSGNLESPHGDEGQQPLHLFLSSSNLKSLDNAKLLAENLLDTICAERGASRVSSRKAYSAVPPPQQLLNSVRSSVNEIKANAISTTGSISSSVGPSAVPALSSSIPGATAVFSHATVSPQIAVCYPQPCLARGTSYSGYEGIYPQATPLQQVALALRQSPSPVTSAVSLMTPAANTVTGLGVSSSSETERRTPQKRKFQELPVASKDPSKLHQNSLQGSEFRKPSDITTGLGVRNITTMPAPKKLVQPSSNEMPPPPPRTLPTPPPKFNAAPSSDVKKKNVTLKKAESDDVPDTLVQLLDYGDDDDDLEETIEEPIRSSSSVMPGPKPFWAL